MAGKKRSQQDVVQSKTAKRSVGKQQDKGFQPAPLTDMQRVIPLCHGEFAYIFKTDGKTWHGRTDSAEYAVLITELTEKGFYQN